MSDNSKYLFFYGGYHSQWYESPFEFNDMEFNCAEQFMMYGKALCFGDEATASNVMRTKDPAAQKALGRKVKGYDDDVWKDMGYNVVVLGTFLKATQNPVVYDDYCNNLEKGIELYVEASPTDRRWGIGISVGEALRSDRSKWNGDNLLGQAVTEVSDLVVCGKGFEIYDRMYQAAKLLDVSKSEDILSIFD
jgi:ribA/ribD-fused uncharacterized protein